MFLIQVFEHDKLIDIYIALVNGIGTIKQLFTISWCTDTTINYNWVTLKHNLHKV